MGGAPSQNVYASYSLKEALSVAVRGYIKETINTDSAATCTNNISITNVSGCHIDDLNQACEAQAVMNVTANLTVVKEAQERIFRQINEDLNGKLKIAFDAYKEQAKADFDENVLKLEEALANATGDTEFTYNAVHELIAKVSYDSSMRLSTTCTRYATASNTIDVDQVTCDEASKIQFGAQRSTAAAIGDCVANVPQSQTTTDDDTGAFEQPEDATEDGFETGVRKLNAYLGSLGIANDDSAEATVSLEDLQNVLKVEAAATIVLSLVFLGLIGLAYAHSFPTGSPAQISGLGALLLLAGCVIVWWPGYLSIQYGIIPWNIEDPDSSLSSANSDLYCNTSTGELKQSAVHVNKLAIPKVACLEGDTVCESSEILHYQTCGLFAGCDDPALTADLATFQEALRVCQDAPLTIQGNISVEKIADVIYGNAGFEGCKPMHELGGWLQNGADVTGMGPNPIALDVYGAWGEVINADKQPVANSCELQNDTESGRCYDSKDDYTTYITYDGKTALECMHPAYHLRKKTFVNYLRATKAVAELNNIEGSFSLAEVCPPRPIDFFQCDENDACTYTALDPNDDEISRMCKNDFSKCTEKAFLEDLEKDALLSYKCRKQAELKASGYSSSFEATAGAYAAVLFVLLAILFYKTIRAGAKWSRRKVKGKTVTYKSGQSTSEKQNEDRLAIFSYRSRIALYIFIALLLIGLCVLTGPPFGLLGAAIEAPPLYTNGKEYRGLSSGSVETIRAAILFGFTVAATIFWIIFARRQLNVLKRQKPKNGKNKNK